MPATTGRRYGAVAAVAVGALMLSACGSSSGKLSLHDQLPEAIRKAGTIRVGASLTATPVIFKGANGQADGLDADIAAAMEQRLGVKLEFQDVGLFQNVLPGVMEKKYDIGFSGITDTRARQQGLDKNGKTVNEGVDFVDYFIAGIAIMVHKGNPDKITKLDDLCGRTVVVKKGTIHDDLANSQVNACKRTGTLTVNEVDSDAQALEQVRNGTAAATLSDYAKAQYNAQTLDNGQSLELTGNQLQLRPYGIAVPKSSGVLRDVLVKAINSIVEDGTYGDILAKRTLSAGAIQNSVVNGGN
ncbi:transporter substrate-binding domain-containing protein [Kitasatospora sp. McL0602]|uniref:transporter substrate-binding domain-containing protein n=1 Tax=Kitasatospora sp. McL0602 TaxID=3439530 RepID=UPI003F8B31D9